LPSFAIFIFEWIGEYIIFRPKFGKLWGGWRVELIMILPLSALWPNSRCNVAKLIYARLDACLPPKTLEHQ
jgi:hypothetical protein